MPKQPWEKTDSTREISSKFSHGLGIFLNCLIGFFIFLYLLGAISYNHSGTIMIKQAYWTGKLTIKDTPGPVAQLWGHLWKFRMETSVKFDTVGSENVTTAPVFVRHNDGGTAEWCGTARFKLPQGASLFKILRTFGSEKELVNQLFTAGIREICTSTSVFMSTEESYSTKRAALSDMCSDQAQNGVYFVNITFEEQIDEFGKKNTIPIYNIRLDKNGKFMRKSSIFGQFDISVPLFKITNIKYLGNIDEQIQEKMSYGTKLQVANADIQTLEQKLNEVEALGKKQVTEAEMAQEKNRQTVVQQKEAYRQTELNNVRADSIQTRNQLEIAKLNLISETLQAQGEAAKRAKQWQGDKALSAKLEAYKEVMAQWCKSIQKRKANAPQVAANWDANFYLNLLNSIDAQVKKDLGLDLTFSKLN
jgi:hypothetical protein